MNAPPHESVPMVNIIILAAGKLSSTRSEESYPLCLSEIGGSSLLEHIVKNTSLITKSQYTFVFLEDEERRFHLGKVAVLLVPDANIVHVPELSQGSACTALFAACQLRQDAELIIISANELVDLDLARMVEDFRGRELDAGTLIFRSVHPRYSYVRLNKQGLVTEAAQRNPISFNATAGVFWFAKTSYFVEGAKSLLIKDAHVDGSYFVAPTFNEMVLKQKKVGVRELDLNKYFPLKSEHQIDHFIGGSAT